MGFARKVVWITGASSGIGEALALAFAGEGASVILSARRTDVLERVATSCATPALVLPFDATHLDALPAVVHRAFAWSGAVDMLVNNAGISQRSLGVDTSFEVYRHIMEVDFFAPVRLTQLVLPRMLERRSGHLVAVASIAGKLGVPFRTGYCAAKHALVGYFDALRAEVADRGVQVSVVTPGFVRTAIDVNALRGDGTTAGSADPNIEAGMDPSEAAAVILGGLDKGKREIAVGKRRDLAALLLKRLWPERLFDVMAARVSKLA
ncbi:SDR family oxidoreductase [Sorangium sp. So ce362]|uniref:SDR family oxidoreductase n=1 Tax=Sorangium sp. So ce362 TaxID=3133303 RepID=UPI003F5DB054